MSPVLHSLAAATMKAFLALTFFAALSLAVSLFGSFVSPSSIIQDWSKIFQFISLSK
jgi:hypothetical protein